MRNPPLTLLGMVAAIACLTPIAVGQSLPSDKLVTYAIHEDSSDPNSSVIHQIILLLKAAERDRDLVRWVVKEVEVREKATGGGSDTTWVDDDPTVNTASGQWWVDHEDADDPVAGDFVEPPLIEGVADPEQGTTDALEFSLEGLVYSPPPEGAPWVTTGAIGYELCLEDETEAFADDPDEPVELPPVEEPPVGN